MLNVFQALPMFAVLLLLVLAGCQQPKEPPVISSLDGRPSVEARDSIDYTCNAIDPNLSPLSFSWSQEGGRLGWDWGRSARWFAPESSGTGLIRVTVTNEDGLSASDSLVLTVRAETADVLFWDAAVKAGDFQSWADTVRAGYRIYGSCGSDSGRLHLKVMDDSNFTRWANGQSATPLRDSIMSDKGANFSVRINAPGLYHIIIDNKHGARDYSYWLNVWKAGP
jgi:hypothetical protein